ncbi:hypothetical protein BDN71DRAFT_1509322 [Pleurotus eryngii]|uniref:Uncharacterized protein n=1 Tax=Pleurotus eryngii TaxID=5323 RepID=A0A9P5ZQJ1_PLEER|nr:hypothetical protein BDN71DRAFT_1509322 [Pleurotus eryngii]
MPAATSTDTSNMKNTPALPDAPFQFGQDFDFDWQSLDMADLDIASTFLHMASTILTNPLYLPGDFSLLTDELSASLPSDLLGDYGQAATSLLHVVVPAVPAIPTAAAVIPAVLSVPTAAAVVPAVPAIPTAIAVVAAIPAVPAIPAIPTAAAAVSAIPEVLRLVTENVDATTMASIIPASATVEAHQWCEHSREGNTLRGSEGVLEGREDGGMEG